MKKNNKKRLLAISFILVISLFIFTIVAVFNSIPNNIVIFEDENYTFENGILSNLFSMEISVGKTGTLKDGEITEDNSFNDAGNYSADVKLLGQIPVKTINVNVIKNKKVVPCGNPIGVKLFTDGILVVGLTNFKDTNNKTVSPAETAGIKISDLITEVNSESVASINDFSNLVERIGDGDITLTIKRDNNYIKIDLKSKKDITDGKHKIGLWVRNSAAGIGTLTYYDPDTSSFGALGHGITDMDTEKLMPASSGSILGANIVSVKKGEKGLPGELVGVFADDDSEIGSIKLNSDQGIYGNVLDESAFISKEAINVASRNQIKEGKAQIRCCISGQTVKYYNIEIQKVMKQSDYSSKGMVIKIVDEALLKETGGIVQGMSGSPIIQNGMLVGAVTHVFINDPTRGYGIFIDSMLNTDYKK